MSIFTHITLLNYFYDWLICLFFFFIKVDRALSLYRQHEMMRAREGLASNSVDPFSSPLKEELKTAKFTVLPTRDENGAALAIFNARLHEPSSSSHKITLQGNTILLFLSYRSRSKIYMEISWYQSNFYIFVIGVIHQLDVAMEDFGTQSGGLVFVYNMYGSKYANFDYDLSQKMLTLLKGLL